MHNYDTDLATHITLYIIIIVVDIVQITRKPILEILMYIVGDVMLSDDDVDMLSVFNMYS